MVVSTGLFIEGFRLVISTDCLDTDSGAASYRECPWSLLMDVDETLSHVTRLCAKHINPFGRYHTKNLDVDYMALDSSWPVFHNRQI